MSTSHNYRVPRAPAPRPLGRDTAHTVAHWDRIIAGMPIAPRPVQRGPRPRRSRLRRFHHATYLSQDTRGFCVGHNFAGTLMSQLRVPRGGSPESEPLEAVRLNPIYQYDLARLEAAREGIDFGFGDGALLSTAARGAGQYGCVERSAYEASPRALARHGNGTVPPEDVLSLGRLHPVAFALLESVEHAKEMLAGGFFIVVASEIPQGMMQTDPAGFFRMQGPIVGGHCVPPDALIGGPIPRRAHEVRVGDQVTGHDGKLHAVEEVLTREYQGDMITVMAGGNIPTQFTEEHPLLVYRPLRRYGITVRPGMDLAHYGGSTRYAKLAPRAADWEVGQPVWIQAASLEVGDYILHPKRKPSGDVQIPRWADVGVNGTVPRPIESPDPDLAWLFGLYIADGNREMARGRNKGIGITLSNANHVARAVRVLRSLGLTPRVIDKGRYTRVKVPSVSLCRSFREWFGEASGEKHIPEFLYHGWDLAALVEGLCDGDGCRSGGYRVYSTISEVLMRQVWSLLIELGHRPRISAQTKRSKGAYPNGKAIWHIRWQEGKGQIQHARFFRDYYAMPVRDVIRVPYEGTVYNYEVADVHSYVADGAICHNCYQWVDYDEDADRATIGQAWKLWGEPSDDPRYSLPDQDPDDPQDMLEHNQLGTCPLEEFERSFSPGLLASGRSELCVVNAVPGFDPPWGYESF